MLIDGPMVAIQILRPLKAHPAAGRGLAAVAKSTARDRSVHGKVRATPPSPSTQAKGGHLIRLTGFIF